MPERELIETTNKIVAEFNDAKEKHAVPRPNPFPSGMQGRLEAFEAMQRGSIHQQGFNYQQGQNFQGLQQNCQQASYFNASGINGLVSPNASMAESGLIGAANAKGHAG